MRWGPREWLCWAVEVNTVEPGDFVPRVRPVDCDERWRRAVKARNLAVRIPSDRL